MNYDVDRMAKIYNHVFSTPRNSPERTARLEALSEADQEALFDYSNGILSGRIKKVEAREEMTLSYAEWKELKGRNSTLTADLLPLVNFEKDYPVASANYQKRLKAEEQKRKDIMAIEDVNKRRKAIAENLELFGVRK